MSKVKFENSLALHEFTFGLIKDLSDQIKNIPEYKSLKLDPELTKWICKTINQLLKTALKSKVISKTQMAGINKNTLVVQILKDIFVLTVDEITQLESQIDFSSNNKLVTDKSSVISSISSFFSTS